MTTGEKTFGTSLFPAIAGRLYGPTECELSLTLLPRLVDGGDTGLDDPVT
ncbi:hypothetical protein GCM10027073_45800 [Streptomyces chlorus]|uniref:Uncharacterized protein n=1 Tax=Streptomyces chlorus TaxID=887452 RepID=A0ABW1DZ55_9ACTN